MSKQDEKFMKIALALAVKGRGLTSPNPMVGAVIVHNGKVVSSGYHKKFGTEHAEVLTLKGCRLKTAQMRRATMYVTLEPCCHHGKTGPCSDEIIKRKIGRVVIACRDPHPFVAGRGIRKLRQAGIKVDVGLLRKEAERINEAFFLHVKKVRPFVTLKLAASLDGKIATSAGESKWISGSESRTYVQHLREGADAILVGARTVAVDDPRLNVRSGKRQSTGPVKVIVDGRLSIKPNSRLLKTPGPVLIATSKDALKTREGSSKAKKLQKLGATILPLTSKKVKDKGSKGSYQIDLKTLLKKLGKIGIVNVLVEGGGTLAGQLFDKGLVDKVAFFYASKIIGGKNATSMVEGFGIRDLNKVNKIRDIQYRVIGNDLLVEGYVYRTR